MLIHVKLQNAVDSERQFIFSGRPKRVARDRADERAARKRARDVRESRFLSSTFWLVGRPGENCTERISRRERAREGHIATWNWRCIFPVV